MATIDISRVYIRLLRFCTEQTHAQLAESARCSGSAESSAGAGSGVGMPGLFSFRWNGLFYISSNYERVSFAEQCTIHR